MSILSASSLSSMLDFVHEWHIGIRAFLPQTADDRGDVDELNDETFGDGAVG